MRAPGSSSTTTSSSAATTCRCSSACPTAAFDLIYIDPPFNTGRAQTRALVTARPTPTATASASAAGATPRLLQSLSYDDGFDDYLGFLEPRLVRARELLAPHGTLYFHLDYREAHYCKLLLDEIFGRDASSTRSSGPTTTAPSRAAAGRPSTTRSSSTSAPRARTTSTPTRSSASPTWRPGWSAPEKAARGKRPTDVWLHTIVPTNGAEKTGYPTQKPEGVLRRIVAASSRPGGWCLDPFAGSGTLGAVCRQLGRRFVLVDSSPPAVEVMRARLGDAVTAPAPARVART